jgi:Polyketide cyclase / dehydrase and lipid transport
MWSKSYSKTVEGLNASQVWKVWSDVNQWHTWQDDIEYAQLDGEFEKGNVFRFKPKGGPNNKIELTEVKLGSVFIDLTRFPLAKMYDTHELIDKGDGLEIKTTIRIEGPLSYLWRKLVAENVADGMEKQTDKVIERARNV